MRSIDATSAWSRAVSLAPPAHLLDLFAQDDGRSAKFTVDAADLKVDFSRQRLDDEIRDTLIAAAVECGVSDVFDRMLSGEPINVTENRAVGHMALRMRAGEKFVIDGSNVVPGVQDTLTKMADFAEAVRRGDRCGATGRAFTHVVNIGIGGSDLGPRLVSEAMRRAGDRRIECRFVGNVDPMDLSSALEDLDPAETLFVVSSKTFTTIETMTNAHAAATWIRRHLGQEAVSRHLVAVSADPQAVRDSGVGAETVFPFWEWVGGRFSVASSVGLSVMIEIGPSEFRELLEGLRDIDEHVRSVPPARNAALLMALVGIWNHAVLGSPTRAVIPYAHGLRRLPAYLQQLMMESNGKSVRSDGTPVSLPTSPIVWGDEGTNAQHAFMQLLHQGTTVVPVDFIGFARTGWASEATASDSERILFMNMVAQAQALAFGRVGSHAVDAPHRSFAGNRPSTVIVAGELTARTLGQIIGLYEHAVFYEGALLGINSFDQWGVELGKEMASDLVTADRASNSSDSRVEQASRPLVEWFEAKTRGRRS